MLNPQGVAAWHITLPLAPKPEKLIARFFFVIRRLPSPKTPEELNIYKYSPNNQKASLSASLMITHSEIIVLLNYVKRVSGKT